MSLLLSNRNIIECAQSIAHYSDYRTVIKVEFNEYPIDLCCFIEPHLLLIIGIKNEKLQ